MDKLSITEKATPAPTPAPTSAPTPAPTPAAMTSIMGFGMGISAVGDPHLTNIHGERFDLMKPGKHNLITIPRKPVRGALLRVYADAQRFGGQCDDIYFQELNITGTWADAKKTGGFRHRAHDVPSRRARWVRFGSVRLKVAHG